MKIRIVLLYLGVFLLLAVAVFITLYSTNQLKMSQVTYTTKEAASGQVKRVSTAEADALEEKLLNEARKSVEDFKKDYGFVPDQEKSFLKQMENQRYHTILRRWKGKIFFLIGLIASIILLFFSIVIMKIVLREVRMRSIRK